MKDCIEIVGARENNLKNIDVCIPRNKLVVFTGLSGSGKSSLAFDTIFAEGQRRYMESLSSYARMFLGQMQKPDVDKIEGLSPAIAIDQKTTSNSPRSTVGTVTEIYDYFRLLFAHIGEPFCVNCGTPIKSLSVDQIVAKVFGLDIGTKLLVLAPTVRNRKGEFVKLFESYKKQGYVRVKVDGEVRLLEEDIRLDKNVKHNISVVVDRLVLKEENKSRIAESVENATKLSNGLVVFDAEGKEMLFSTAHACPECGFAFDEITPRLFSFNTPIGACPECTGVGFKNEIDENKVVPNPALSINEGAICSWGFGDGKMAKVFFEGLSKKYGFSLSVPFEQLDRKYKDIIFYGTNGDKIDLKFEGVDYHSEYKSRFEGVINNMYRRYKESTSDIAKAEIEKFMNTKPCEACGGKRLNNKALSVKIDGKNIFDVCSLSVDNLLKWVEELKLSSLQQKISAQILKEIKTRLKFLKDVGLEYLSLNRAAGTLSGGEAQRIRLATQIGSGLVGVTYILDEPSIGLHTRDTFKLIGTLKKLRDLGNTIIVVEHDDDVVKSADFVVDVGPKAGVHGGEIVATGSVQEIMENEKSLTGQYLSGKKGLAVPRVRRVPNGRFLEMVGVCQNNLKNVDVKIPLGLFTCVTGVSGSGKSSLVNDCLFPALSNRIMKSHLPEGKFLDIYGEDALDKVIVIDQSPIGRTPRSNPATYTGVWTHIRELFASTPDAKAKGYNAGRFSFNVKGGRCETCGGDGVLKIEMHFLPDVYVTCEDCHGKRYNNETLEVRYKGKNINEILEMTVETAVKFFENIPSIKNKLQALFDVGLGYIKLGQPATTLSGGEAQRVKLATELARRATGNTMYILDEPTTGLHPYDVEKLVGILQKLVNSGNTVLVIEHNKDVIKVADYIIDIGPEGGDKGGTIVCQGAPEEIAKCNKSYTGEFLKDCLN